jgi:hypothetical protein
MTTFEFGFVVLILPFIVVGIWETIRERAYRQGYEARDAEIEYERDAWQDNYYER